MSAATTDDLLTTSELTRRFGGLTAVAPFTNAVGRGELLGIVGPNGAGKTTLFNLLTGQIGVSGGSIDFDGRSITGLPAHHRAQLGIARTFQTPRPLGALTVRDNVIVGALMRFHRRSRAERKADEILEVMGLADRARARATELALPDRKALELGRALATEPKVLLLDEVMAGLNPAEAKEVVSTCHRLNQGGLTIVLIEHNLGVVRALCRRLLVLAEGKLIAEGDPDAVLADPAVVEAYIGRQQAERQQKAERHEEAEA